MIGLITNGFMSSVRMVASYVPVVFFYIFSVLASTFAFIGMRYLIREAVYYVKDVLERYSEEEQEDELGLRGAESPENQLQILTNAVECSIEQAFASYGAEERHNEFSYFAQKNLRGFMKLLQTSGLDIELQKGALSDILLDNNHFFRLFLNCFILYLSKTQQRYDKASPYITDKTTMNLISKHVVVSHSEDVEESGKDLPVGVSEMQGMRRSQEDHYFAVRTPLTSSQMEERFKAIVRSLSASKSGSCSIYSHVSYDARNATHGVFTSNLGDSRAVLFLQEGSDFKATRLSVDHRPSSILEQKLVALCGGEVSDPLNSGMRVGGVLGVTRSMGDHDIKGVITEPDRTGVTLTLKKGQAAYLVLGCDGVYERLHEWQLAKIIKIAHDAGSSSARIANYVRKAAFNAGSGDNITVMCLDLTTVREENICFGIQDGHAGKEASFMANEYLRDAARGFAVEEAEQKHNLDSPNQFQQNELTRRRSNSDPGLKVY
jgi:serine/threonine protein phosphatase PrpC